MKEYIFQKNREQIPEVIDFIRGCLEERKISRKNVVSALLAAEEILVTLCEAAEEESEIRIAVGGRFRDVHIRYSGKGKVFTAADIQERLLFDDPSSLEEDGKDALHSLMERLFERNLGVRCRRGTFVVRQRVQKSLYYSLVLTLTALVLGLLAGLCLQLLVPSGVTAFVTDNLLTPVYTVIMNAFRMIVAPLVFFSVASSIAGFSDLRALGRIAGKVISMYFLTSLLAIGVGLLAYRIFPIGNPALAAGIDAEAATATVAQSASASFSVKDLIVGIVPTDIISPFLNSDMLKIVFLAVCIGLTAAALSGTAPVAKDVLSSLNALFSKITELIVSLVPLMVFCSMAKMMATMGLSSFMGVNTWVPVICFGDALMLCVYLLLLLIFARLNPITFLRKYSPAMLTAFTLSSSNATLPTSIRQCKAIGISERVYAFSLPLGATINMDGNCVTLIISALFFAKIYQIPVTGALLFQLIITILVLSIGAPGVPAGNLVCLTLLLPQIGVPAEAVSLIMGLYPLNSMIQTMTNVTGDAVVTLIAAKTEQMVDTVRYNG